VRVRPAWWRFRGFNAIARLRERITERLDLPGSIMVFVVEDRFERDEALEALAAQVAPTPDAVVYRRAGNA